MNVFLMISRGDLVGFVLAGCGYLTELRNNPFWEWEDKADKEIPTGTLQIYEGISEYLKEKESKDVNRASAASLCVRRRWYQKNGFKGGHLTPRKVVNFLLGDLSERALLFFIKKSCVGPGKLYSEVRFGDVLGSIRFQEREIEIYQQKTLTFQIEELTITGHADGFGKRNSDDKWELIEIKSAADYGFKEFQENGPGNYLNQSHALMLTDQCRKVGVKTVRFFYLRKSTGHVWDRVFEYDETIARQVLKDYVLVNKTEMPKAPYDYIKETYRGKETGKWTIGWQCQYCNYLRLCKPNPKIEWKKDKFGQLRPSFTYERN